MAGINRPYFRTCRQMADGTYADSGQSEYIRHPLFAASPEQYTRGFELLQKDVQTLFDYVEPADANLSCYSFRIHELLLRVCVEVESNCKAILLENGYTKTSDFNMNDYRKIEMSHRLSSYKTRFPIWTGSHATRTPFAAWATSSKLDWYQSYNLVKHDRHAEFQNATFASLTEAFCGLHVLLSAQFHINTFTASDWLLGVESSDKQMQTGIGNYMWIQFPIDWQPEQRYDFDWPTLEKTGMPFQHFDYSKV
jgi:hypothetical protein